MSTLFLSKSEVDADEGIEFRAAKAGVIRLNKRRPVGAILAASCKENGLSNSRVLSSFLSLKLTVKAVGGVRTFAKKQNISYSNF